MVGMILGALLTKFTNVYQKLVDLLKNNPIEFIIGSIATTVFLFGLLSSVFKLDISENVLVQSLGFFASVTLSWILTNLTNEKAFEKKQKESAIRSYRHSIKLKTNIDYSIGVANIVYQDMLNSKCPSKEQCHVKESILRLRDALITAQINAGGNINDWSDIFSDQLLKLDLIKAAEDEKRKFICKKQEYDPYDMGQKVYLDDLNAKIVEKDSAINQLKSEVESSILLTLIQDDKFREEHLNHIKKEQEFKEAMRLQRDVNIKSFRSRQKYEEDRTETNQKEVEA